jgi:hypothetical protein
MKVLVLPVRRELLPQGWLDLYVFSKTAIILTVFGRGAH